VGDTGRGRVSAGVRTWTAWRTAAVEVSGGVCGKTAPVHPRRPAWRCWPDTDHAHATWTLRGLRKQRSWAPRPAAVPQDLPCPRWPPQGPPPVRVVSGGGRRPDVRREHQTARGHQRGHDTSLATSAGHHRPDGDRSGTRGRTADPPLAQCRWLTAAPLELPRLSTATKAGPVGGHLRPSYSRCALAAGIAALCTSSLRPTFPGQLPAARAARRCATPSLGRS
jgi:hypothetical protein